MEKPSQSGHFVYIVKCADGTLYTGYAANVTERIKVHNAGRGAKYTKPRLPVTLVYSKEFLTKSDAMKEEARIKKLSRREKLDMSLERFVTAQERDFDTALSEIRAGSKRSHWMWYIFPQIQGLGLSPTARFYAIKDLEEAKEYLENPYLSGNLQMICDALLSLDTDDPSVVFGYPDDLKLCSSMTLFSQAAPDSILFRKVLEKFFDGIADHETLRILKEQEGGA